LGITDAVVGKINLNPSRADRLDEAAQMVENAKGIVEELRDELQTWLDGIPENMQGGDRASQLETAIEQLGEIVDSIGGIDLDWNVEFPSMMG
jgi:methyl-accepting chemotaxis protein